MRCLALLIALVVCTQPALSDGDAELKVEIVKSSDSCSRKSKKGDILSMHYTGTLVDGKEFDSSRQRGEPFRFQIGLGQVIKGWDQGLLDMCVGDKRKLTVPPSLGYGEAGAGDRIPPGATLVFETELTKIEDGPPPVNVFKQIDSDQDEQLTREEASDFAKFAAGIVGFTALNAGSRGFDTGKAPQTLISCMLDLCSAPVSYGSRSFIKRTYPSL
ncbi:hypothetical protein HPB51_010768 [Rhipicephalus microplus]|uniref:peptidylprolyl isomerase n=1 Tax=Rhipicephalus microplus TaxID=6941 RepID=A0A9J6DUG8_RHIMP|nr:hypothetical protein HPB51_010768 [Rhipicephalus microplus]